MTVKDDHVPPLTSSRGTNITVVNSAPVPNAGGPYQVTAGLNLVLSGGGYDPNSACGDSIVSYAWDVDNDGAFDDAFGPNPAVPWTAMSSLPHNVFLPLRLQVYDAHGAAAVAVTTFTILDGPDIGVTKTANPASAAPGQSVTFTIVVTNVGPAVASGVAITDVMPPGLALQGASSGNYNPTLGVWNIGGLVPGIGTSLVVSAQVMSNLPPALLVTFTNSTFSASDRFGETVAALGGELVVVGAPGAGASYSGAAYLYSTNETLLVTFTNPTPAGGDWFGAGLAALGEDRVIIGAPLDDAGANDAGVAHLFNAGGLRLTTFTNPAPANSEFFGSSVAALGSDRVIVGAYWDNDGSYTAAGRTYLFASNGVQLTTFTNPARSFYDSFGFSVAALGSSRALVGEPYDDAGATDSGVVHIFGTNGVRLVTITNPVPVVDDRFGWSVAALAARRT